MKRLVYLLVASFVTVLIGCGERVKVNGNAERAWQVTLSTLRATGALTPEAEARALAGGVARPRIDREHGEIDLPFVGDYYRGESALFVFVDVSDPDEIEPREVRFGIDSELGNFVVRPGRALQSRATEEFAREFKKALRSADLEVAPSIPVDPALSSSHADR